jgi:hypothetical protein
MIVNNSNLIDVGLFYFFEAQTVCYKLLLMMLQDFSISSLIAGVMKPQTHFKVAFGCEIFCLQSHERVRLYNEIKDLSFLSS